MPRTKKKQTGKVEFDKIIWVIDNLTSEQIKKHDKKPYSPSEIMKEMLLMIDKGFKITAKYDNYSKSYMVSASCMEHGHDNSGLAVAARGTDVEDCLSIVIYKFITIAERDLRGFSDKIPQGVRG